MVSHPGAPVKRLPVVLAGLVLLWAMYPARAQGEPASSEEPAGHSEDFSPKLTLHGFSDVTLTADRIKGPGGGTESSFALGQLDLYMVSRLTDYVSVMGEIVFELEDSQESVADVERLFVKYRFADALGIALGRVHTALGYWNEAFHHGALLQPSVERPEALKFEDDGGILPVHSVGLEISGGVRLGSWSLNYVTNLANGRGLSRETVQGAIDVNRQKAMALKMSVAREGSSTFRFGPTIYTDVIPADPATLGREGEIGERILGGHFVYAGKRLQVLAEYYAMDHRDRRTRNEFDHQAWYAYVIGHAGNWKPYVGADTIDFEPGDPYFVLGDDDLTRYLAGIRHDFSPFSALKAEVRREDRGGVKSDVLAIQTAFTF